MHIYCLELRENKIYVGKTINPIKRIMDHINNNGSAWCKQYGPPNIKFVYDNCDEFDEDKYVKILMNQYGIDNVRGGSYSQIKLTKEQINNLKQEINGATDACFACGSNNHFVLNCPTKRNCVLDKNVAKNGCINCGKDDHWIYNCPKSSKIIDHSEKIVKEETKLICNIWRVISNIGFGRNIR